MSTSVSPALRALLESHVDSFEKLEVIIALHRAGDHPSTPRELADSLNLDRAEVRGVLDGFARAGLTESANGFVQIAPRGPLASAVSELATIYADDKSTLVIAIAEISMERLRNMAGRAFAEAFVIRKKPGGDDDR